MLKLWPASLGLAVTAFVALSAAAAADDPPRLPPLYQEMLDCKTLTEAATRLACYDAKVGALAEATAKREVVVTDKAEIRKAKRGLFGFSVPIGALFNSGDEDEADEVKRIETTVTSARQSRSGAVVLTFKEGGTWEQTDAAKGFALTPRSGDSVVLIRGALGSYFVSVKGRPGIRMRRIQ